MTLKKMNIVKKCPACGSTKISGTVSSEEGRYLQKIQCKKCGYTNRRDIGSSERQ